jgi:hypothetical protein
MITATLSRRASHSGSEWRKVAEMRRVALTLIGALLVFMAGTASASAAPIVVDAQPEKGGVTVRATVVVQGTQISETIETGQLATSDTGGPGLCATGVIHTSCTPASEAAPQK